MGQSSQAQIQTNLVALKEKNVNKGLRCFFLVIGKRMTRCSPAWKRQHLGREKNCWFRIWQGKKNEELSFWLLFASQWEQNEKVANKNSLVLKRQQKSSVLNPFLATDSYTVSFLKRKLESGEMPERGKASVILGSQQAAKHFQWDSLFFPLYLYFRRPSSNRKLVE